MLEDPGEPAFPDEDARGELAEECGVNFMELFLRVEVLGQEPVPLAEALGEEKLRIDVGSLSEGCGT